MQPVAEIRTHLATTGPSTSIALASGGYTSSGELRRCRERGRACRDHLGPWGATGFGAGGLSCAGLQGWRALVAGLVFCEGEAPFVVERDGLVLRLDQLQSGLGHLQRRQLPARPRTA